jgi:hypothetical protein
MTRTMIIGDLYELETALWTALRRPRLALLGLAFSAAQGCAAPRLRDRLRWGTSEPGKQSLRFWSMAEYDADAPQSYRTPRPIF